jgi:hypothetical protein
MNGMSLLTSGSKAYLRALTSHTVCAAPDDRIVLGSDRPEKYNIDHDAAKKWEQGRLYLSISDAT